jgi:hypothetical protein
VHDPPRGRLLIQQDDEWPAGHRYLSEAVIVVRPLMSRNR